MGQAVSTQEVVSGSYMEEIYDALAQRLLDVLTWLPKCQQCGPPRLLACDLSSFMVCDLNFSLACAPLRFIYADFAIVCSSVRLWQNAN